MLSSPMPIAQRIFEAALPAKIVCAALKEGGAIIVQVAIQQQQLFEVSNTWVIYL